MILFLLDIEINSNIQLYTHNDMISFDYNIIIIISLMFNHLKT